MRAYHLIVPALGLMAAGCATHHTRSIMSTTAGHAPLVRAEETIQALGYARRADPPVETESAQQNARKAWQWWPGSAWWTAYRYGVPVGSRRPRPRFWIRSRPDGGWDQVLVTRFASASAGGLYPDGSPSYALGYGGAIGNYWSRWVVHAGTFGPDGKERRPSREARADAERLIAEIRAASHDSTATTPRRS